MVNAATMRCGAVLALATLVLIGAACLRSAEYDEQYTLFLTAGVARPVWPEAPFPAAEVQRLQSGHAGLAQIAHDLRATDVHPPLYFWLVTLWRRAGGSSLLAARLLSVLCSVAALALVGAVATRTGAPPALAMLLTLGCYGFAYTGSIARGFALAQLLLLGGTWLLLGGGGRRTTGFAGGMALGAAVTTNYLAAFVAAAVLAERGYRAWIADPRRRRAEGKPARDARSGIGWAAAAFLLWLPVTLCFFVAQRDSRPGQFPSFAPATLVWRLAMYGAGNVFGGVPLYAPIGLRLPVGAGLTAILLGAAVLPAWWRIRASPGHIAARPLLLAAMAAPAAGLALLGAASGTVPVELRYLSFALPFAGILLAGGLAGMPRRARTVLAGCVLGVQALSIAGLLTRAETMQPARAAALAAARLAGKDGLVLLPRGNDDVGIVGAFGIEAPPTLRMLAVDGNDLPAFVGDPSAPARPRRLVVAGLAQDAASRAALPRIRALLAAPCWHPVAEAAGVVGFEWWCGGTAAGSAEQPAASRGGAPSPSIVQPRNPMAAGRIGPVE